MELYRQGKVSIGKDGYYKVNGFTVDTERVKCECPDYRSRRQACKHYFAACFFQKNRGKVKIEHLNGFEDNKGFNPNPETPSKSETNTKSNSISYDKQRVITRLACLNTAVEVLKTNGESIQSESLFETARQLEQWALGQVD